MKHYLIVLVMASACGYPDPRTDIVQPDGGICEPIATCPDTIGCGDISDGCGGTLSCGGTCQLVALDHPIANTGDTITLEGTFGESATVQFPGGVMQPAVVLGAHRATVVIPADATTGGLDVTTGGVTVGPLPFRRAPYQLGLQSFEARYDQAAGAHQSSSLSIARIAPATVAAGNSLYVIGGFGGGYQTTVERAVINADGSLGRFAVVGNLVVPRASVSATVIGSSLYVIGGDNFSGQFDTVERATINADGTLGPFALVPGVTLEHVRTGAANVTIGNFVYLIGGFGSEFLASVERAEIAADGSLGTFSTVAQLTGPRGVPGAVVVGSSLYVIGGDNDTGSLDTIERATIAPDGTLGPFAIVANRALVTPREGYGSTVTIGNAIYVIGGFGGSTVHTSVERAAINADGSIGTFAVVTNLVTPRALPNAIVAGNDLYVIAGRNVGDLATIERASLNASGSIGTFEVVAGVTPVTKRHAHGGAVLGAFAYIEGGAANGLGLGSVERAPIGLDGTIGAFASVAATQLVTRRDGHRSVVIGGFNYVLGGFGNNGSSDLTSVERATINDDGSLGAFATVPGVNLAVARAAFSTAVIGGFLYVIGGTNHVGNLSSVERATINPDGSLGQFSTVAPLTAVRTDHVSVVLGNGLYVISGGSGSAEVASIERATINPDGTIGAFAVIGRSLITGRRHPALAVVGNSLYVIGGLNGGTFRNTVEKSVIAPDGSLGAFATVTGVTLVTARFGQTSFVAGNSLYLVSGADGSGQVATIERAQLN